MKSSLTLLCLVVWVNVDASSAQTGITCGDPGDPLVSSPYRWRRGQLGETQSYKCKTGFKTTNAQHVATCTSDGSWTPDPLCEEIEGACINPTVMNGYIVQSNDRNVDPRNRMIYYSCNVGFKPSTGGWWGEATCTEGTWSGILECIDQSQCGRIPVIPNTKKVPHSDVYNNEQTVTIDCKDGYTSEKMTIKCKDGEWQTPLPACKPQGVPCDPPPKVENAIVEIPYQNKYIYGFEVNYECRKFFEIDGLNKITCENGNWTTPPPTCKPQTEPNDFCGPPPHLINGDTMGHTRERYRNGQSVQYVCQQYYILDPPSAYKTCRDGIWIGPMTCLKPCTVDEELMNTQNIEFKYLPDDQKKQYATHWDHITFKCTGHRRLSPGSVDFRQQCINGVMNLPHCQ